MPILDDYFGKNLDAADCWQLEMCIHEAHREGEADLRANSWFDYRGMLPARATYLFAAHYRNEYLEGYKRTVDIRTVDDVSPFSPDDIFRSPDLVSMWLARREADKIGCKYSFYIRFAFQRCLNRGWRSLPRPNQLYSEELSLDAEDAWKQRCREVMQIASSSFFSTKHYVGHPDQNAYHAYIVEQINKREQKHLALARVLKQNILPYELAGKEFGPEVMKRAAQFCAHA